MNDIYTYRNFREAVVPISRYLLSNEKYANICNQKTSMPGRPRRRLGTSIFMDHTDVWCVPDGTEQGGPNEGFLGTR